MCEVHPALLFFCTAHPLMPLTFYRSSVGFKVTAAGFGVGYDGGAAPQPAALSLSLKAERLLLCA